MRRFLLALLIIAAITLAISFFLMDGVRPTVDVANKAMTALLALFELVGIVLIVALLVVVIGEYIRRLRPHYFLFDGFSNISELSDAEKGGPYDLNALAREELVNQLGKRYLRWKIDDDFEHFDTDKILRDDPFLRKGAQEGLQKVPFLRKGAQEDKPMTPPPEIRHSEMMEDLKAIIDHQNPKNIDLMNTIGEAVPKEASAIVQLVNQLFLPHAIKATGYLQCKGSGADLEHGITLELQDLGNQSNLGLHTYWQKVSDGHNNSKFPLVEKRPVTGNYIDLLRPTMRWLTLLFLEQQQKLHRPASSRILPADKQLPLFLHRENKRQARLHCILEALYFEISIDYADKERQPQYPEAEQFFWKVAIEHFNETISLNPEDYLPYLYLANMYALKMEQKIAADKGGKNEKSIEEFSKLASQSYLKALEIAKKADKTASSRLDLARIWKYARRRDTHRVLSPVMVEVDGKKIALTQEDYAQQRVLISLMRTNLILEIYQCDNNPKMLNEQASSIEAIVQTLECLDPTDLHRPDYETYLYELVNWYAIATFKLNLLGAQSKLELYLAYCLGRAWDMRGAIHRMLENFEGRYATSIIGYLSELETKLEAKRSEKKSRQKTMYSYLKDLPSDLFKQKIEKIMRDKLDFPDNDMKISEESTIAGTTNMETAEVH